MRSLLPKRVGAAPYHRRTPAQMAAISLLVYHHTHAGPGRPTARDIASYQTGKTAHLPFPAIAYHLYVEADGTVEWCQPLEAVTWHAGENSPTVLLGVGSRNWQSIACAFSGDSPTEAQIVAMRAVGDHLDSLLGRHLERKGHREVSVGADGRSLTQCPGLAWLDWIERVR